MTPQNVVHPPEKTLQNAARPIKILVVEDGEPLRDLLGRALRLEGWSVCEVADGASALEKAQEFKPDAIVLDVMLPDLNGIRVVTALRASGDQTPVLFLTALDSTADRVEAYMAGGDDYMTKPFSLEGVASRLSALVRTHGAPGVSRTIADLVVDDERREVWRSGDHIIVTPTEFRLLDALLDRAGTSLDATELAESAGLADPRSIETVMTSLSKKLDSDRDPLIAVTAEAHYRLGETTLPARSVEL